MRQPINAHSPPKLGGKATLYLGIHTHPRGSLRSQPSFRSQNAPGHPCKIWKTSRVLLGSPSMATRTSGRAHERRHVRAHTHEHGCKRNVSCAPLLRGRATARNWWYQARYVDARICVRECERMQVRASECVLCVCGREYVACVVRHVCAGCEWVSTMRHVSWTHVGRQQKIPTP